MEQHNIFHNEVKAIGPHLAKDKVCIWWSLCGGVGQRRGHTWSNLSPRPYPQEQNSELQAKYQKLLVRNPGRRGRMGGRLMSWGHTPLTVTACSSVSIVVCEVPGMEARALCILSRSAFCHLSYTKPCSVLYVALLHAKQMPCTLSMVQACVCTNTCM